MARRRPRVTDQDLRLATAAREKRKHNQRLTREEERALEKVTWDAELRTAERFATRFPKWMMVEWSRKKHKTLDELAERFGIPILGEEIDLPAMFLWLFDFLIRKGPLLNAADADPLLGGVDSPWLERYRMARTKLVRLELHEKQGQLIAREAIHQCLGEAARVLRSAGERLHRDHGADAGDVLTEALDDTDRLFQRFFEHGFQQPNVDDATAGPAG